MRYNLPFGPVGFEPHGLFANRRPSHMKPEDSPRRAPEGARCLRHPDRPARYACPGCGSLVCASCWQETQSLCDVCAQQGAPGTEGAPPVTGPPPFEDERLPLARRMLATMKAAFFPRQSAPSFALSRFERALPFFLMTVLPTSALAGLIPFTKTLLFNPGLQVEQVGNPGDMEVVVDVARAMLVQLALDGAVLIALALPYVTLSRSYGRPGADSHASCMLLYRAWLLPAASLAAYAAYWVAPTLNLAHALSLVAYVPALLLLAYAMWFTARQAGGIEWHLSLAVCGVPWVLAIVVSGMVGPALVAWIGLTPPVVDQSGGTPI